MTVLLSQDAKDTTIWEATDDHSWIIQGYMAKQEQVVEE